eukprot:2143075-Alexandrium_andersonii.AAC.1
MGHGLQCPGEERPGLEDCALFAAEAVEFQERIVAPVGGTILEDALMVELPRGAGECWRPGGMGRRRRRAAPCRA